MLLHPQGKRLSASQDQPRIKRRENCADAILHEGQPLRILFIIEYDYAAYAVRMTVQIFSSGMHYNVNAEIQRSLKVRRHKGVVADYASADSVRHVRDGL